MPVSIDGTILCATHPRGFAIGRDLPAHRDAILYNRGFSERYSAMRHPQATRVIHRSDYQPPPFLVEQVDLEFDLDVDRTRVKSRLTLQRNPEARGSDRDLVLNGVDLKLLSIRLDDEPLAADRYHSAGESLHVHQVPDRFVLETEVDIEPARNTALEGLYVSGDFLLTQCEAEGFRKITYFPDRPDVMARFTVTLRADGDRFPVLLSNGNPVGEGRLEDGRIWSRWEDPFPKPSYLFALVAGDLEYVEEVWPTASGREVKLRIYVEPGNLDRCGHALTALRNAMRWDEERFGLEYDLDRYNVVVTNDFNMGAMENKGLNIFNARYVLACPDTATDADYQAIEGVIAHEYFHNWTGNRVTCRDWFQLTLKEGLTVYRDQSFSADMHSAAVQRIEDVDGLRRFQYPQDAGPQAHPIRPDEYIEVNNFYTATVYQKGAEVVRMYATLLGKDGFRRGMDLYFRRHDGQAVTCDDFRAAMADANGQDLTQFERWYSQAGTPCVRVQDEYLPQQQEYRLTLSQHTPPTPGQPDKAPLHIPFAMGLMDADGQPLPVVTSAGRCADGSCLLELQESQQTFVFTDVPRPPIPSLLRDFSAPVNLDYAYTDEQLAVLMAHDTDAFARWNAGQQLLERCLLNLVDDVAAGRPLVLPEILPTAFEALLADTSVDPSLTAQMLTLPDEVYLAERMSVADVDSIHTARTFLLKHLGQALASSLSTALKTQRRSTPYQPEPGQIARRRRRNACLAWLVAGRPEQGLDLAAAQFHEADNMTDRLAALRLLVQFGAERGETALAEFEQRWRDDPLVMDKWFAIQAVDSGGDPLARVQRLTAHPAFRLRNPNKVRALIGSFAHRNATGFHRADGKAYDWLAEQIIALDQLNPQVAARLATAFDRWRHFPEPRRGHMRAALARIAAQSRLSPDVFEIVSKALEDQGAAAA